MNRQCELNAVSRKVKGRNWNAKLEPRESRLHLSALPVYLLTFITSADDEHELLQWPFYRLLFTTREEVWSSQTALRTVARRSQVECRKSLKVPGVSGLDDGTSNTHLLPFGSWLNWWILTLSKKRLMQFTCRCLACLNDKTSHQKRSRTREQLYLHRMSSPPPLPSHFL